MDNYKTPKEIVTYTIKAGITKANRPFWELFFLGIFAGMAIALGAVGNLLLGYDGVVGKLLGASVFPVGLMLIVLLGAELFTSNTMIVMGVYDKKIKQSLLWRNLLIVIVANFIGALFIALISSYTHTLGEKSVAFLVKVAQHKVEASSFQIFCKGILCNVLVCGGVLLAYASKDVAGKIFGIFFPIMLFIVLGYDHVIANMLYLPLAYLLHAPITIGEIAHNFLFAGLGNLIGGCVVISATLYYIHGRD